MNDHDPTTGSPKIAVDPAAVQDGHASVTEPPAEQVTVPQSPQMTGRATSTIAEPQKRSNRLLTWMGLALCVGIALPALLPALRGTEVSSVREARAIATSLQTWQHFQQWPENRRLSFERFEPYLNRRSQSHHAPGLVWLHMAMFHLSVGDDPTLTQAVTAARLLSTFGVIMMIGAVFWAAYSVGGHWAGPMAGLLCAANPVLLHFGNLGTATVPAMAMETLSVAAALWAIRPLRPSPTTERQFLGWLLCGVLTAVATFLRGPWAVLDVGLVVLTLVVLCPDRISHLLGLLASILIAVLLVAPWGVYTYEHAPDAWSRWSQAALFAGKGFNTEPMGTQVAQRNLMLLLSSLPWSLWLIGAVLQPFSTSSRGARIRMFLGLIWVLTIVMLFVCRPGEIRLSNAVTVAAPLSVLIALLFSHYGELADRGRSPRTWRVLRWPHLVLLLVASGGMPAFFYAQSGQATDALSQGWRVPTAPWWTSLLLGIILMSIALFSLLRLAARDLPRRSLITWALWTIALCVGSSLPAGNHESGRIASMVDRTDHATLVWLSSEAAESGRPMPDPRLLLHTPDREVMVATPEQVTKVLAPGNEPLYLFGISSPPPTLRVEQIDHDPATGLTLYRSRMEPRVDHAPDASGS